MNSILQSLFVMEQHLGHHAYYQNIRQAVEKTSHVHARWVEVSYSQPQSLWERWPVLPEHLRGTLSGMQQVRRGLRENSAAQVVFFNTQVPAALAGSSIRHKPYVIATDITPTQYDTMAPDYNHNPDGGNLIGRYKHGVNRRLFLGASRILPWSTWTRTSLIDDYGVDPDHIEVIAPGVDLERWKPAGALKGGKIRILFVGGDFYRKGGQLLLEAYRSLPTGTAELVLVTRSQLPPEEGITVYNGLQPNSDALLELYRSCDLFVLPTRAEAFGIAAVEASAAGLPVIATRVGGLTDIVLHGQTGFLIQSGNVQELSESMRQAVGDPALRSRLGQAAREHAVKSFDAQRNAARMIDILRETAQ